MSEGLTAAQVHSLAESYAYERWPEQTVNEEPDLLDLARHTIEEWLRVAEIPFTAREDG